VCEQGQSPASCLVLLAGAALDTGARHPSAGSQIVRWAVLRCFACLTSWLSIPLCHAAPSAQISLHAPLDTPPDAGWRGRVIWMW
jgi:hypothetical protein